MLRFYINSLGYMAVSYASAIVSADLAEMQMDITTELILSTPEMYA